MKKIIVTGYNGFLGSHIVNKLSKKYEIIGISNNSSKSNDIQQIKKDVRKVTIGDIPKDVFCIVHLAALTDVVYCENNPTHCFEVNVKGTQNMIEIARRINSKFIFLSTSHVYGSPKRLPIREDAPINPASIYAASKFSAEVIAKSYSQSYEMDVAILRLFSVYGPNSSPQLVTTRIIHQLLTKKMISLGNLYPKRDFIFVNDALNAIDLVITKSKDFGLYNVGTGKGYSILDICNFLKKIANKNIQMNSIKSNSRKMEINEIISDSSKMQKLGWKPRTGILEGLKITFDWFAMQKP